MKDLFSKIKNISNLLLRKVRAVFFAVENFIKNNGDFSLPVYLKKGKLGDYTFFAFKLGSRKSLYTWSLTFLLCIGVISPVLWFVSSGYRKLIPSILGIEEVAYELPTQRTFASGYDDVNSLNVTVSDTEVKMSPMTGWWNGDYSARKKLEIKNLSGETSGSQLAGSTVSLTINTKELYDLGFLQNDCDDLRIIYSTDGVTFTEKERSYAKTPTATNCSDSGSTTISFPLQSDIANAGTDGNYYLYYGNGSATSPSYGDNGFDIKRADLSTVNATLVCPFNGSTTCLDGETPSTATGAIRFDQNNVGSAMSFDGVDDWVDAGTDASLMISPEDNFTYEAWVYLTNRNDFWRYLVGSGSYNNTLYVTHGGKPVFYPDLTGSFYGDTWSSDGWHYIAITKNGTSYQMYQDGEATQSKTTTVTSSMTSFVVGSNFGTRHLRGSVDELVVYNRALSGTEIQSHYNSGSPSPIVPDSSTVLLYHFDENGNDPRFAGKVIDSSGNGNHGTINGNAQYIAGKVPAQNFASHQGVFIEEGTTNLVDNPSFENNITDLWDPTANITQFTNGATDADGNTYIGNNNVNDVYYYDTTKDSTPEIQVQLGVDPNWRKGVVLKTGTLSTTNNGSLIEVTGTNANGNAIEITITGSDTFSWTDGGSYSGSGVAMSKGTWIQLETGTDDIWVRFSSTGTFTTGNVFRINSWVIEPFSATRGKRRDFPEQAWLVATDSTLDVIDATEDKLWMRFNVVYNGAIRHSGLESIFPSNGNIYLANSLYAYKLGMPGDRSTYWSNTGYQDTNNTIGKRNFDDGNTATLIGASPSIVDINTNDVHAAVINNKQYVAVATDGGVSVINETDGSVISSASEYAKGIFLTSQGDLYFHRGNSYNKLAVKYDVHLASNNFTVSKSYSYASVPGSYSEPNLSGYQGLSPQLFVTEGTSKVDGVSNTVYLSVSTGLNILQEKQGDESNGSVKYFTKDEITEEMIGDIRGAWGFNTNAPLANGNDVQDVSVRDTDMTAVADAGGIGVVEGVRGKAFQFDGTNDYLTQKVYEDQVGASWGPSYHGLSLASGQAFARVQGVSLAPFAGAANPYMLVVKDEEGDVAWGYIDTADTGETLGSEFVTNGDMELDSDWVVSGTPSVNERSETRAHGGTFSRHIVTDEEVSEGISQNITGTVVGKLYKISAWIYIESSTGVNVRFDDKSFTNITATGSWQEFVAYRTYAGGSSRIYFRTGSAGDEFYVDDISVKEVTHTATDGVAIMSTKGGSTQAWAGISANFNYNASAYTFEVRKTDFQITGDLTVGAWVKTSDTGGMIISKYSSAYAEWAYQLYTSNGNVVFRIFKGGDQDSATSPNTYVDNNWHFVSGVFKPSQSLDLYIDGVLVASDSSAGTSIKDTFASNSIGANYTSGASPSILLSGTIDEPFITAEALSATQIKNMFDTGCRAMGGTPGTGTCTGINEAGTTNNLAGSVNIVNAVTTNPTGTLGVVATDGSTGAVSVLDLTADKLVKTISTATTPALVNNDSTALAVARFDSTNPQLVVGSDANGASVVNNDLTAKTQNTTASYSRFGTDSLKLDNSVSATNTLYKFTKTLTAASYTYSFYAYTDGNQVTSADLVPYLNNGEILTNVTYEDAGGGFTRIYGTFRGFASASIFGVKVKAGKTVYIDGVQLEAKAYPTTYADGSLGTGYAWSGTAHNSNSVRTAVSLRHSSTTNVNAAEGTISFWVKPGNDWREGSTRGLMQIYNGTTRNAPFHIEANPSNDTLTAIHYGSGTGIVKTYSISGNWENKWQNIIVDWSNTSDQLNMYVNGTLVTSSSGTWQDILGEVNPEIFIGENWNGGGKSNSTLSDLRIFDQALTATEVTDLYYQGLQTHQVTETKGRYDGITDASYYSGRIDLSAVSLWSATDDLNIAQTLNGGTISYYTCTKSLITGTCAEEDYLPITGNEIQSSPARYMFVKTVLNSSDTYRTPVLTGLTFNYTPDNTAPTNPTEIHTYSSNTKELEYEAPDFGNSDRPYFEWSQAGQTGGATDTGEGSSGVNGYYVYFGSSSTAVPQTAGTYITESTEGNNHYQLAVGSPLTTKGNYYLRIQTMDNAGSIQSTIWDAFTYQYDNEVPDNPTSVSVTPAGWSKINSYEFYWPLGSDNDSELWGYCYKTGDPTSEETCIQDTNVQAVLAYQSGENIFYLRSIDNAGNKNPNFTQTTYYYNADAPSAPNNLDVDPDTSDTNEYTFTWDAPSDFSGEIKGYYYSINTEPTLENSIFTTETQVGPGPYATRQGENKFYTVAEDTAGNKNFAIYAEVSFYANTTAPTIPTGLSVSDSSDRANGSYSLTLNWADVTGTNSYNIYRSIDGVTFENIATVNSSSYMEEGLDTTVTYFYYVTAEDNAGAESGNSATVSRKPTGKYTEAPTITVNPKAEAGRTSAVITWETDRESNSFVQIGTDEIYSRTQGQWEPTTKHSVEVKGLNPSTEYHYRVQSLDDPELIDYNSNDAFSQDYTFTTGEIPKIKDLEVKEIRHTTAIVTWTTDVTSTSVVYLSGGEDRTIEDQSSGGTTQHTILVENLKAGTTYTVRVSGVDEEGNTLIGEEHSFTTPSYPNVTDVRLEQQKEEAVGTIKVSWTTNVPTTSIVIYNKKGETETVENSSADLVTDHELLISGLADNSEYEIIAKGRDTYGNEAQSEINTFTTDVDTRPPKIENVTIETGLVGTGSSAKAQIVISWKTDELSTSQIEFDTGIGATEGEVSYNQKTKEDQTQTDSHVVVISELQTSQVYRLRIVSKDKSGNTVYSDNNIVVTDEATENALELVVNSLMETFGWLFGE